MTAYTLLCVDVKVIERFSAFFDWMDILSTYHYNYLQNVLFPSFLFFYSLCALYWSTVNIIHFQNVATTHITQSTLNMRKNTQAGTVHKVKKYLGLKGLTTAGPQIIMQPGDHTFCVGLLTMLKYTLRYDNFFLFCLYRCCDSRNILRIMFDILTFAISIVDILTFWLWHCDCQHFNVDILTVYHWAVIFKALLCLNFAYCVWYSSRCLFGGECQEVCQCNLGINSSDGQRPNGWPHCNALLLGHWSVRQKLNHVSSVQFSYIALYVLSKTDCVTQTDRS